MSLLQPWPCVGSFTCRIIHDLTYKGPILLCCGPKHWRSRIIWQVKVEQQGKVVVVAKFIQVTVTLVFIFLIESCWLSTWTRHSFSSYGKLPLYYRSESKQTKNIEIIIRPIFNMEKIITSIHNETLQRVTIKIHTYVQDSCLVCLYVNALH